MKEKTSLIAVFLIVSMIAMAIIPAVKAWVYPDTTIAAPHEDNYMEPFGPRADKIQINMYQNELAEFTALELGQIDMTDWPVDAAHYGPWTTPGMNGPGYQDRIAVVDTGPEFGLFLLDMRMDNRSQIASGVPNPAYNSKNGNPMANVALRRAIASICDRDFIVNTIISGGHPPALGSALYTDLSLAYGVQPDGWGHPELNPAGALAQWCYVLPNSSANVAGGLAWLAAAGYTYDPVADATKDPTGYQFTIELYYRIDHTYRSRIATEIIIPYLQAAPPNGLGMRGNLVALGRNSAGCRLDVMAGKKGHMYTGGWGLTIDPDHLYYLFHVDGYWHPGRPPNYMYYPGDGDTYTVPSDGWHYTGFPSKYGWTGSGLDFSDPDKTYNTGDEIWMNPNNYWSWEMMIATTEARAKFCALKSQEFLAYYVCGVPLYASKSYTAFHRTYTGAEAPYTGQNWMGVVNQKGLGVWSIASMYNMHTENNEFGDGTMTIRQGFRQPTMSLNPLYAEWVWDWYVMNNVYDGMITANPYTLSNVQNLAAEWDISTWDNSGATCTKITFNMRHDLNWSDGTPLTSSDVKFTWGGPEVTGSISNLLAKKGYPPTYWSSNIADILSVATPDPYTVIVYLDVYGYFGLHSMSGFNIVLPEHIWKPIIETGNPIPPWDQPSVCSSGYVIDHTWDPTGHGNVITLSKNVNHNMLQPPASPQKPFPALVWTKQFSSAIEQVGNTHYIFPKLGQTTLDTFGVFVYVHNLWQWVIWDSGHLYIYPKTNISYTKDVTLYRLTGGVWQPVGVTQSHYVPDGMKCIVKSEMFTWNNVKPGLYRVKVSIHINDTWVYDPLTETWVDKTSTSPYVCSWKHYYEYAFVTARYDIGGAFWKIYGVKQYQPTVDFKVDVKDLYACAKAYGTQPGYPNWNTACDVNNDYKVDVKDYYKIAQNYGWTAPD
jgi:ABC-type transport system substrate-binding protein